MTCVWDWLTKHEAIAVWVEAVALIGIFIWDRIDFYFSHRETVAQLRVAQDQIKLSQNAERGWVLTELDWSEHEVAGVVTGTGTQGGGPVVETTTVGVKLTCHNEGRSPAWIDGIKGYCELVEGKLKDLPSPVGHEMQSFLPTGPIAPGKSEWQIILLTCPGHVKKDQLISIFVSVEYRDIFENRRVTTCGYTVRSHYLSRQDQFPERNRNT